MHIRIITGSTVGGKVYVRPITCHRCGHDTWEWEASLDPLPFFAAEASRLAICYCHKCNTKLIVEENSFLFEATNEKGGWFAYKQKAK